MYFPSSFVPRSRPSIYYFRTQNNFSPSINLSMSKEIIKTEFAPAAIGPYSQAVKAGKLLFVSGQIPIDYKTGNVVMDGIEAETHQVMKNIIAILEAANTSLDKVVKTTIF